MLQKRYEEIKKISKESKEEIKRLDEMEESFISMNNNLKNQLNLQKLNYSNIIEYNQQKKLIIQYINNQEIVGKNILTVILERQRSNKLSTKFKVNSTE